jgi:hypothetical protein
VKFTYAATAVCAFALGVLVRDQAQDFTPKAQACERAKDNAERFATAIAAILNGGVIYTDDAIAACRVKHIPRSET